MRREGSPNFIMVYGIWRPHSGTSPLNSLSKHTHFSQPTSDGEAARLALARPQSPVSQQECRSPAKALFSNDLRQAVAEAVSIAGHCLHPHLRAPNAML